MLRRCLLLLFALAVLISSGPATARPVLVATIHGAITPASASYFLRALDRAAGAQAEVLVLQLDTPGGLDTSMREMIQALLASKVPVVIYVAPSGARAASAGTYLLYASHVAAMAPGTNLGAATPVQISATGPGEPDKSDNKAGADTPAKDTMKVKMVQDASAYLRSLAQLRGRNVEWAEKAVRDGESLSAQDALERKVIDLMAADLPTLLRQLHGRSVVIQTETRTLATLDATVMPFHQNWQEALLATIADPNVALLLMMIGVYGLLFEFYTPGMFGPGVLGGICLLLGMYGLAMLPINSAGAALVLLGIVLMIAEGHTPTFGALGIGGVVAFIAGALMLIDADIPGLEVSLQLIVPLAAMSALITAGLGVLALKARRRQPVSGRESMLGGQVRALSVIDRDGYVEGFGERWQARSTAPLRSGQSARVIAIEGLTLVVEPDHNGEPT